MCMCVYAPQMYCNDFEEHKKQQQRQQQLLLAEWTVVSNIPIDEIEKLTNYFKLNLNRSVWKEGK